MATTFKFYEDSGGVTEHSGVISVVHKTDQSDNPQVFTFYLMSLEALNTRTLEAVSAPGTDQITISVVENVAAWQASTAYSVGDTIEPTVANGEVYVCTTGGVSGGSEPGTWGTNQGDTVSDNTVVWTNRSDKHEDTEIELSLDGVSYNAAGASLDLGTTLYSAPAGANAQAIYVRITNAVTEVSNTSGEYDLVLQINNCQEEAV